MRTLAAAAAILLAGGCLGSSAAHAPPISANDATSGGTVYAQFHIHSRTYTTTPFGGEAHTERFTIRCAPEKTYLELQGALSWSATLCVAILDYQAAARSATACTCASPQGFADLRGAIRGHPIRERITTCLCGNARRAVNDARIILKTHPPPPP